MILRSLLGWMWPRKASADMAPTPGAVLDRYFEALESMKYARGAERERIAADLVREAEKVRAAFLAEYPGEPLPQFPAYERLAIELEKQGRLADAAQICRLALDQGWQDVGFGHRIARCERKLNASGR